MDEISLELKELSLVKAGAIYWDTEYHLTLRLDVFDKNGSVLLKGKALTASTTFFYQGSAQEKIDHDMRIQEIKRLRRKCNKDNSDYSHNILLKRQIMGVRKELLGVMLNGQFYSEKLYI